MFCRAWRAPVTTFCMYLNFSGYRHAESRMALHSLSSLRSFKFKKSLLVAVERIRTWTRLCTSFIALSISTCVSLGTSLMRSAFGNANLVIKEAIKATLARRLLQSARRSTTPIETPIILRAVTFRRTPTSAILKMNKCLWNWIL